MKRLLVLLLFFVPLREVENIKLSFPAATQYREIFFNYANDNFSQELNRLDGRITAEIKSTNFLRLNLNFRIIPGTEMLEKLDRETREVVNNLLANSLTFDSYFKNISFFLEKEIEYSEADLPQDEIAVLINRRANCVGYANLTAFLLNCVGVKNRFARGFYLQNGDGQTLIPIPHKWIEIFLGNGGRFFYDPQRQRFSTNYIVARYDVDFTKIRKFKILLLEKSKRIINLKDKNEKKEKTQR
ncbi:MAG: transglutaminase-like domain-containing protein [Candidatus Aminicenantes bacterium]|nr:transglutaminase-like domain-containing protein [Candidatus Aminicenantes bacterium]